MYPPGTVAGRETAADVTITSSTGTSHHLPKGTFILLSMYTLHRSEEHWGADANTFRPERFMEEGRDTAGRWARPYVYLPFLAGEHGCVGQRFAMLEIQACCCSCHYWCSLIICSYRMYLRVAYVPSACAQSTTAGAVARGAGGWPAGSPNRAHVACALCLRQRRYFSHTVDTVPKLGYKSPLILAGCHCKHRVKVRDHAGARR
jgi:hypothetical protein